jgi:CBS domain-containing protein
MGIVMDRDLAYVVGEDRDANSTKVQDVMTRQPVTCRADDDIQKTLDATRKIK